jgi:hypothetical protein
MTHTVCFFLAIIALYVGACLLHIWQHRKTGKVLLALGASLNAAFLIDHSTITGFFVWNALVDPVFFIPFVIAMLLLLLPGANNMPRWSLVLAFLYLVATTLFAALYPKGVIPPAANKTGLTPFLFFFFENCAYALFGLSGILTVASSGIEGSTKMIRRLVILGFVSFSIAQVVGALWSFLGWGHAFMWGSRHLSSAAVWLVYAAVIHMRFLSSFVISERGLTMASGLFTLYIAYSHLLFEMGIPRAGS